MPTLRRLAAAEGAAGAGRAARRRARSSPRAASSTPEGDAIGTRFAPKFISSTLPDAARVAHLRRRATPPRGPREASLDKAAAEDAGLELGDTIELAGREPRPQLPPRRPDQARRRLLRRRQHRPGDAAGGAADHRQGAAASTRSRSPPSDGVSADGAEAPDRAGDAAPRSGSRPAQENADRSSDEIRDNLGFLRIALLVFAFVALFVGAFLIFNTFSITVAQRVTRVRDAAHARRLRGGRSSPRSWSRRWRSACSGRCSGSPAASRIAKGLNALFDAFGIDLPTTGLVLETATVVVSLLVGIGRHAGLLAGAGAALDAGAADGGAAGAGAAGAAAGAASSTRRSPSLLGVAGLAMVLVGLFGGAGRRRGRGPDGRRRGRRSSSASRCSARGWCGRSPRSPAGRWSGCAGSPAASPARTRSATRAAPRSPPRR